jgi:uncharacterized protein YggU (UPF0235/DUF167 family)
MAKLLYMSAILVAEIKYLPSLFGHSSSGVRLFVEARPGSGEERVEDLGDGKYKVWVREPADKGSANKAIILALSKHLDIPRSHISIRSGHSGRNKVLEVLK